MASETPVAEGHSAPNRLKEGVKTLVVAFALAIFIRATVAEARFIPSESMVPALEIGDRLIVEKISSHFGAPKRGDILVFYPPKLVPDRESPARGVLRWLGLTGDVAYIKRVVGLPGETLSVKDGRVYINGKALDEPYVEDPPSYTFDAMKIPEGHLFMMGDNRNNSMDSHIWGALPMQNVIGHAVVRFWPLGRMGPAQ